MTEPQFVGAGLAGNASALVAPTGPPVQPEFLRTLAREHERAGFDRVIIGQTPSSPDAVSVAGAVLSATDRLGAVITAHPAAVAPTTAARALATLEALHPARVGLLLPATDGEHEAGGNGAGSDRPEHRRRTEFAELVHRAWTSDRPFDHGGEFYPITGCWSPLRPPIVPPVFVRGASAASDELVARLGDVYLLAADSPDRVAARIVAVAAAAGGLGRTVRFGLSLRPILADTEPAAQAYADRVLRTRHGVDVPRCAAVRQATGALDRLGPLVGTPARVSQTLRRYRDLGVSVFQLSGYRPLADVRAFGDLIAHVRAGLTALTVPA